MLTFDVSSPNLVLVQYPGGGYGNLLHHLLTEFLEDTVKVNNNQFAVSGTGNSHNTVKYTAKHETPFDREYVPEVFFQSAHEQIAQGQKFLVLCDPTPVADNRKQLLAQFSNAHMVRVYTDTFIDRLVMLTNLMTKSYTDNTKQELYKNSLLGHDTVAGLTDEQIVDMLVLTFRQKFNAYGIMFNKPLSNDRIYNFNFRSFTNFDSLLKELQGVATFLNTSITDAEQLKYFFSEWKLTQSSHQYYDYTADTVANPNDLTGQALVKFYATL